MKKAQCKEAVDVYRKFLTRQEGVHRFLQLAEVREWVGGGCVKLAEVREGGWGVCKAGRGEGGKGGGGCVSWQR